MTSVTNANISAASLNAFTGASNINIGNTTGTTTVNHNVTILGNLTVQGDTTYVNTNVVTLEDPIISLGGSPNGGPALAASAANKDRGLELKYIQTNQSAASAFMGLDVASLKFVLKTGLSDSVFNNHNINHDDGTYGTLKMSELDVTNAGSAQGAIDAEGDVNVEGKVHAATFELDSAPNFAAAGTEFNSHFSHAVAKHALPIGTVVMYDSGLILLAVLKLFLMVMLHVMVVPILAERVRLEQQKFPLTRFRKIVVGGDTMGIR